MATIAEALDKKYGNAVPSETIAEALGGMKGMVISEAMNVLNTISVSASIANNKNLFGKHVNDLQKDVVLSNRRFTGTLKYVSGYTGFSGNPDEQQGNYIVFKVVPPTGMTIGTDLTVKVNGSALDSDGHIVLIVKNQTKPVVVVASKDGYEPVLFKLSLKDLVLEPAPEEVEETPAEPEPEEPAAPVGD